MLPAYLEIEENDQFRVREIDKTPFPIGRTNGNVVRLDSMDVSRAHAVIELKGDRFVLRDLKSKFGTMVNGIAIKEHALRNGDVIAVGPVRLRFRLGSRPDEQPTVPIPLVSSPLYQITLLLAGLRAMGSGRGLEEVLNLVVDSLIELCDGQRGFVMLPNAAGELTHTVARARGKRPLTDESIVISRRIPEQVFLEGNPIDEGNLDRNSEHTWTRDHSIRSAYCVPLRIARAAPGQPPRIIGVLYVDSREAGRFIPQTARAAIEALADEAALAIQLYQESMEKLRVEHEMKAAADVQRTLFPARSLNSGAFEVAGETMPCLEVGGDFLDYFCVADDLLMFMEADVEGKGLPAAILGAKMQGIFSGGASFVRSPSRLMEYMNRALAPGGSERRRLVTMACATLDAEGLLTICRAGHNPPIVLRASGRVEELTEGGIPLGLSDWTYPEQSTQLAPGDLVILYSDGVNECENVRKEQFGVERVLECLGNCEERTSIALMERLFGKVSDFLGSAERGDDITVLAVRYLGRPNA